jgi:transcriptional regulator with XRE-family HTH domain
VRDGKRSEPSALSLAVIEELKRVMAADDAKIKTPHALAKAVAGTVSRSQVYNLLNGVTVIDVSELYALCSALGVRPVDVVGRAERERDRVDDELAARRAASETAGSRAARKPGRKPSLSESDTED